MPRRKLSRQVNGRLRGSLPDTNLAGVAGRVSRYGRGPGALPVTARIVVRFVAEGWHCWPAAPEHRSYLASRHRHLFHVEVRLPVVHEEREVEFHDLLDAAKVDFGSGEFGAASCETLARDLCKK